MLAGTIIPLFLLLIPERAFSFGPFGPKCPSFFTEETCQSKSKCTWCASSDGDDSLCFSRKTAKKLNDTSWVCSTNETTAVSTVNIPAVSIPVPTDSFFSVFQKSNDKHCVELLCDSEVSYNSTAFQIYWGLHGYQYDKYAQGMCASSFDFVNLKDTLCNTSMANKTDPRNYGCSIFTLGVQ